MNDDYVAKTIAAYDHAPDTFESATHDMTNYPELKIMLRYLPDPKLPILDVGCGYGRDMQALTDMGYPAVGIDLSEQLLKKAQALYPNFKFTNMDVRALDFPAAHFGAVWCRAVLLHLNDDDIAKALSEIRRILVPGGVVAVSMKEGAGQREVVEKFSSQMARFYNFMSRNELNEFLTQAEFSVKESHVLNERERFGPDKRDLNWVWSFAVK